MNRYIVVSSDFTRIVEDSISRLNKAAFCVMRGVPDIQVVEGVTIAPLRLAVRNNSGTPEVYEAPSESPSPLDPRLETAINRINDGASTPRILAFVMSHPQFPRIKNRIQRRPSTAERRLKVLKEKIIAGTETPAELREALVLLIGEVED